MSAHGRPTGPHHANCHRICLVFDPALCCATVRGRGGSCGRDVSRVDVRTVLSAHGRPTGPYHANWPASVLTSDPKLCCATVLGMGAS